VIGIAGPAHQSWLEHHGVTGVEYGDGIADRLSQAADRVDAFIDTVGGDYVRIALDIGVQPARIDTIVNFGAVAELGVQAQGNAAGASAAVLAALAGLVAADRLDVPIAASFPLSQVSEAYRVLERGGVLGKVVLIP
jgi:NADPH:quinone reductase-like Zn-dependent oxidoreductase